MIDREENKVLNILILAAGKGSRMGDATKSCAKPALRLGLETIVGRLLRQLNGINYQREVKFFVNCSYQPYSVVDAIRESGFLPRVRFLWEYEPFGSAITLRLLSEGHQGAWLVIHGDLVFQNIDFSTQFSKLLSASDNAVCLLHRRHISLARSIATLDGELIIGFQENGPNVKLDGGGYVWVNSGVYLFRHSQMKQISAFDNLTDIPTSILPRLARARQLSGLLSESTRISVETVDDLARARTLI